MPVMGFYQVRALLTCRLARGCQQAGTSTDRRVLWTSRGSQAPRPGRRRGNRRRLGRPSPGIRHARRRRGYRSGGGEL